MICRNSPILTSAILILLMLALRVHSDSISDQAVFESFSQSNPELVNLVVLNRASVGDSLELVIALGSPNANARDPEGWVWWSDGTKIGLFLQEVATPANVHALGPAIESGHRDCMARIERVTATDVVLSCVAEKVHRYPNQKWVFDAGEKRLIKQFSYQPFSMDRVHTTDDRLVVVGNNQEESIAVEFRPGRNPEFEILHGANATKWTAPLEATGAKPGQVTRTDAPDTPHFGPSSSFSLEKVDSPFGGSVNGAIREAIGAESKMFLMPQSTYDEFAVARSRRVEDGHSRSTTTIVEWIGPWQIEGDKFWFGKTFYDGEGNSGVGGFGYFDPSDQIYHMFAPPEIADWSVSAIHVTANAVWLALKDRGEYRESSGGLLRYDRNSGVVRKFDLRDITNRLVSIGDSTLAATEIGVAVVKRGTVKRYFVDRAADNELCISEATE
ncbi:MAG: hypothetical protein AMXMBFR84_10910 [Candidatus Hydrogenedentota bacterium]